MKRTYEKPILTKGPMLQAVTANAVSEVRQSRRRARTWPDGC